MAAIANFSTAIARFRFSSRSVNEIWLLKGWINYYDLVDSVV